jgi:hypothetical protein
MLILKEEGRCLKIHLKLKLFHRFNKAEKVKPLAQ